MTSEDTIAPSRFIVGIDLGTTNCAVAYVDTQTSDWNVELYRVLQWVDWNVQERRDTLPSFHYEFSVAERDGSIMRFPWQRQAAEHCVGFFARDAGMRAPGRRIASAKSWLCHDGVDRTADLLPWHGDADVHKLSPVVVSSRYLEHIREAWDADHPQHPLADQDVIITLPASFDEVARELTVEAAKRAGFHRVYLIEEPQAAFYAWIDRHRDAWSTLVEAGQLILVCDIGGGTTDFTLIRVRPAGDGHVQFHRAAVGRHLILGGDNLDLALAKLAEDKLGQGTLPPRLWDRLLQQARNAKETFLGEQPPEEVTLHIPTESSRLIGGALQVTLSRDEVHRCLVEGFFPSTTLNDRPEEGQSGFQEFGLPYAHDPAVTRHLAAFLSEHLRAGLEAGEAGANRPELLLFNGGTVASPLLRQRIAAQIGRWYAQSGEHEWQPHVLDHQRLDIAVARGAAYYGMVRRGQGVRIAANLGRTYYIQVSESPPRAMCLIPGSAQPGERYSPTDLPLHLQTGRPVQFPIWVSSTRLSDRVGAFVDIQRESLTPLPPICSALMRGKKRSEETLDVVLEAELSEIGTLGVYVMEREYGRRWQLQFDIRSTLETDRQAHTGTGEAAGTVDTETIEHAVQSIDDCFGPQAKAVPGGLIKQLQLAIDLDRRHWPPQLLRAVWQGLIHRAEGRRKSPEHEARWLNLLGYCLRPGYGVAVDDWRVSQTWRQVHGQLAFAAATSRTESLILWRRIAGGLTAGQQQQLLMPFLAGLRGAGKSSLGTHELAETWRLIGSLELVPQVQKIDLVETALRQSTQPKHEKARGALLWAIGRLAARQPIYGPLNTTIPVEVAQRTLDQLLSQQDVSPEHQLAIMQVARKTGDRYRDLDADMRQRALRWLEETKAPEHYRRLVEQGGTLEEEEQAALFGESLPLGIQLVRTNP